MIQKRAVTWSLVLFLGGCTVYKSPTGPDTQSSPAPTSSPTPAPGAGLVSITLDDGFVSGYAYGVPLLRQAGFPATFYIVTRYMEQRLPAYMDSAKVQQLAADGYEIGHHTRNHTDLTKMDATQLRDEVIGSRQVLEGIGIKDIQTFAYPFGAHNGAVIDMVREGKYSAARSVDGQINLPGGDRYALHAVSVHANHTLADIQKFIDDAQSSNAWLILVFHRFNEDGQSTSVREETFRGILDYLRQKRIPVVTMKEGLSRARL